MATVTGNGPAGVKILAARLRTADPLLKEDLRRRIRREAAPLVRKVQASILDWAVAGAPSGEPLRPEIARTVSASVTFHRDVVTLNIVSAGRKMPGDKSSLPYHTDQRNWGHPVYAHGPRHTWTWVRQVGKPGWFEDPVRRSARDVQAAIQAAGDAAAARLEH